MDQNKQTEQGEQKEQVDKGFYKQNKDQKKQKQQQTTESEELKQSDQSQNTKQEIGGTQNFKRRDRLIVMQKHAQEFWEQNKTNESNPITNQKKFFVTFPYPYVNGRLHMGHAFSFSKSDFTARYKRLMGYNVLFPQAFHCTGMPISAAADKLKSELSQYGNPPQFPPLLTGKKIKVKDDNGKEVEQDEKRKLFQYEILQKINVPESEIPNFKDPYYWLEYFPPYAQKDLSSWGSPVDWRRSFITTDKNPYYDSFIRWQYTLLKEKELVAFGKRPSIYSTKTEQMCADHDRSEGEGVGPQEYTLVKIIVLSFRNEELQQKLNDRMVYLVAATLRPETMFGQTNCYILPSGVYGAFEMKNNEVFICSERSARNMSYQDLTRTSQQIEKICDIKGEDLIGIPLKAPLTPYEKVYSLPMMTISMGKGTGIVTSVPSDSPDDWAALRDIKNKEQLRTKYNITEDMVKDFEPLPIIEIEGFGNLSAVKIVEDMGIKSQNDKVLLEKAKDTIYKKGFHDGVFVGPHVGQYAGMKVQIAKPLIKQSMIQNNQAQIYWEPENLVVSRHGDECVVAFCDQWYSQFQKEEWKQKVHEHTNTNFKMWNKQGYDMIKYTIDWIQQWGCSRSFGLGTKLPFDEQYVIESLSDSTIYMSYYTIVHYLQGDVVGSKPGTLGITPQQLNRDAWDYIFLGKNYNQNIQIPQEKLDLMRNEFNYWYPLDLRVSAKDLVKNHLTMSLFHHAAIWDNQPDKWPRSYYVNGYILVNGQKMSKEKGNFFTIEEIIQKYGSDATRFACAEAGDGLDDANFVEKNADEAVLKLETIEMWLKLLVVKEQRFNGYRLENGNAPSEQIKFFDTAFDFEMKDLLQKVIQSYEEIRFRDVTKYGFHEFTSIKEEYLNNCGDAQPRQDLILRWVYWQLMILFPITPHFSEVIYQEYLLKMAEIVQVREKYSDSISHCQFPLVDKNSIDFDLIRCVQTFKRFMHNLRQKKNALTSGKKAKQSQTFSKCYVIYAKEYLEWQKIILQMIQQAGFDPETKSCAGNWKQQVQKDPYFINLAKTDKEMIQKSIKFGQYICDQYIEVGQNALQSTLPFNEEAQLRQNVDKIQKELGIQDIVFMEVNEVLQSDNKLLKPALKEVVPGNPATIFEVEAGDQQQQKQQKQKNEGQQQTQNEQK